MTKLSLGAQRSVLLAVLLVMSLFVVVDCAVAADLAEIRARYSQPRGTKISWKIHIPSPPPAAVIVLQSIPPGTIIKNSSPSHSSYDSASGTVKWLLSAVQPGTIKMKMELGRPIRKKGEIHGKIIFQDTSSRAIAEGSMTSKNKKKAIEGC